MSSEEAWLELGDRPAMTGRQVQGLVNNAGVPHRPRLLDVDVAGWDRTFAI